MARQAVNTTKLALTGVKMASAGGIADGFKIANPKGNIVMIAHNNNASLARTVTIKSSFQKNGLSLEDNVVSVPAQDYKVIGPIDRETFNRPAGDADAGMFYVDFEVGAESDLSIEVYEWS